MDDTDSTDFHISAHTYACEHIFSKEGGGLAKLVAKNPTSTLVSITLSRR